MMKRPMLIHKKRSPRTPPPVKSIIIITMVLFITSVWFSFWIINQGFKPVLMDIAKIKTQEFATRGINMAVKFAENYDFDDIFVTTTDNEGQVTTLSWKTNVVSKINRVATDRVEEFFMAMNEGRQPQYEESLDEPIEYNGTAEDLPNKDPTVVEIPLGQITGNSALANLGPKIPVNLELAGSVRTDVIRNVEPFGINNSLVTIYILVEADVQVVIPFTSEVEEVSTKIPIDSTVIMGPVPEFYGADGNNPSISVPKDSLKKDK
ncbi:sporulation protein YunB [Virgibacillus siamensis]|uniref:sporulation protein YunB n=1 Tax=Virgibacillus siamensis TaxID=480071 RepID=UPI001FEC2236|nr:sporulation protein YunB [Virgibacillus siamensis]